MAELDGKGAVVTGGSRGIGRAIVSRLLADGATVVFSYHRDRAAADEVVAGAGGRAFAVRADLADADATERIFAEADERLDGLDLLVTNAAVAVPQLIADVTEADYDRVMTVNTRSVFRCLQYAARRMRDGGRIITISSVNTVLAAPGVGTYAASKAAVEQFTKVAAKELGGRGITVNSVSPGATDTDLLRSTNTDDSLRMAVALTPQGRLGRPTDIADVVGLLCRADAGWITGQNVVAAGGMI